MEDFKSSFIKAAVSGNLEDIKHVLHSPIKEYDKLTKKDKGDFLGRGMYDALVSGNCTIEILKFLTKEGANVNFKDEFNQSVLLKASNGICSENYTETITYLVQNWADVNNKNINGQSDFLDIFSKGLVPNLFLADLIDSVDNILEIDLRTGGTLLHLISECQDENKVLLIKKLLEKGIPIDSKDNNGDTPLHLMAAAVDIKSVDCLLENGADKFSKNRLGETILHYLASDTQKEGFLELLDFLLNKGMDINEQDTSGKSVIHHAMMSKVTMTDAVKELVKRSVKINVKDKRGQNEIYYAVDEIDIEYHQSHLDQRAEVIRYLIEAGVDLNEQNIEGISSLHIATLKNDLAIIDALLENGADILQKTNTGATALHWACKNYNMLHIIMHYLLNKNKHDISVADRYGSTALHWAAWFKNKSSTQTLLQFGCDFRIKDNTGNTAGELAEKLNFAHYSWLVEGEQFRNMDFLTFQEPWLECSGVDPLIACQHLKYMRKEKGVLHVEVYLEHLNLHKKSIKICLQKSLALEDMGLFYPLYDNHWVPEKFHQLFTELAKRVSIKYPLFSCDVNIAGSMYEGTKVKITDEFDFIFLMSHLSTMVQPVECDDFPNGFVKIKIKSDIDHQPYEKYLRDGFLDNKLFLQDFYKALNEELDIILMENTNFNHIMFLKGLKEINYSISKLHFFVFGHEAKQFHVSVDVVPALLFKDWVPKQQRQIDKHFLQDESLDHFTVVMKTPERCHVKDFTLFFRISCSYLEQNIIKKIPYPIKKGYILLKIFCESGYLPLVVDHDFGRAVKSYITSYHLKTCLLHEWYEQRAIFFQEKKSYAKDEQEQKHDFFVSTEWARKILDRYKKSIEKKILPSFFNPSKNLLGIEVMNDGIQEPDEFKAMVELLEHILNVATSQEENCEVIYSRDRQ